MQDGIFCSAYFPPIAYFKAMAQSSRVIIEGCETYCKQTYRNRCRILSANGILSMTVPVCKSQNGNIRSVRIDYTKPWLREHKRAMEAAYRSSPFFEYYCDDIFAILDSGIPDLFSMNYALTVKLAEFTGLKTYFSVTEEYIKDYTGANDFRNTFDPKNTGLPESLRTARYYQVFSEKFGFTENLSVLDLLFNEGPNSVSFLLQNLKPTVRSTLQL